MHVLTPGELREALAKLGPDPLLNDSDLSRLAKTSRPVKIALLDQQLVAGVGNICASESLWRSQIDPRRPAKRLGAAELKALHRSIVTSMRKAIRYGPRIFDVQQFAVYKREGKPCRRCGKSIRRFTQAGRSTY
jgi:formamidopyrimidine-DNA glycosylase